MQARAIAMARCDLPAPVPPISTALRCSVRKAPLARSPISAWLTGVPVKSKSAMSLASGSLAMVSRYHLHSDQRGLALPGRDPRPVHPQGGGLGHARHMRAELTIAALTMAIQRQRPGAGLIHHSDRGSQGGFN